MHWYIWYINAGYTIPKGWAVMVCPPAVHLNPAKYQDPLSFNPRRWEVRLRHVFFFFFFLQIIIIKFNFFSDPIILLKYSKMLF